MAAKFSLNDYLIITTTGLVGMGTTNPQARLHITGSGATNASWSLLAYNNTPTLAFAVRDDGNVGVNTSTPHDKFTVNGTSGFTGSVLPGANTTYNLGSTASRWLTAYASVVETTTVNATTINASYLTGSLTKIQGGASYLIAGQNVSITSQSNGQVLISATGGTGDANVSYVVLAATGSLNNERVLTAGSGTLLTDGGAGGAVTISTITSPLVTSLTSSVHFLTASRDQMVIHSGSVSTTYVLPTSANQGDRVYITRAYNAGNVQIVATGSWLISNIASDINMNANTAAPGTAGHWQLQSMQFIASGTSWNLNNYFDIGCLYRAAAYIQGRPITVSADPNAGNILMYNGQSWSYHGSQWTDGGGKLVTTASVAIDGASTYAPSIGTDTYLWVSGTIDLIGATAKKAVFGGDVRISGSLTIGTGSVAISSNEIHWTPAAPGTSLARIYRSGDNLRFVDGKHPGSGKSLLQLGSYGYGGIYRREHTTQTDLPDVSWTAATGAWTAYTNSTSDVSASLSAGTVTLIPANIGFTSGIYLVQWNASIYFLQPGYRIDGMLWFDGNEVDSSIASVQYHSSLGNPAGSMFHFGGSAIVAPAGGEALQLLFFNTGSAGTVSVRVLHASVTTTLLRGIP